MSDHDTMIDRLIDTLGDEAVPVRRVAPAWRRALIWAPVALVVGFGTTRFVHRVATDWSAPLAGIAVANIGLSLVLGLAAFVAALSVSIAGSRARVSGWIVASLAAWLALAGYSIARSSEPVGHLGHAGSYCFTFVMIAGLPMIAIAVMALRRTRSLTPIRSLALAGTGIAFLSFGLLAFCHPVEMSAMDFIGHLAAGLCLGAITVMLGRRVIAA